MIPHFLILGVQKGGTTELTQILRHLDGFQRAAKRKELRLLLAQWPAEWDHMSDEDVLAAYQSHWERPFHGLTFEASPGYISHPKAADRVKRLGLNSRFVITLREPVSRMESLHKMWVRDRGVNPDFTAYFDGALDLFRAEMARDPDDDMAWYRRCIGYPDPRIRAIAQTLYVLQLRYWYALFPEDRFYLTRTQDLSDPNKIMRIVRFCGNPNTTMDDVHRALDRPTANKSDKAPYPREILQPFAEFFAPYTQALYDEFDVDLRVKRNTA